MRLDKPVVSSLILIGLYSIALYEAVRFKLPPLQKHKQSVLRKPTLIMTVADKLLCCIFASKLGSEIALSSDSVPRQFTLIFGSQCQEKQFVYKTYFLMLISGVADLFLFFLNSIQRFFASPMVFP
jgi:hypothetical protein